jgi:antitoxin PrlF
VAWATIISKGQITVPKEIRERLRLKPGDRVEIYVDPDGRAVMERTLTLEELSAVLPRPERALNVREINQAIIDTAVERAMRGLGG